MIAVAAMATRSSTAGRGVFEGAFVEDETMIAQTPRLVRGRCQRRVLRVHLRGQNDPRSLCGIKIGEFQAGMHPHRGCQIVG